MSRKLTEREIENRATERIVKKIEKMGIKLGKERVRHACSRYSMRTQEQNRLEREIQEREEDLAHLKKNVKK